MFVYVDKSISVCVCMRVYMCTCIYTHICVRFFIETHENIYEEWVKPLECPSISQM